MEEIYSKYLGSFEAKFEEEIRSERIGEYHCFDTLKTLDEALSEEGTSLPRRRSLVSHMAEVLSTYVESRLSHEAKKLYDRWHGEGRIDGDSFGTIREELLLFDACYKSVYEEMERFNHIHGDQLIEAEKLQRVREDLIRFEQLVQTYIRLLELQVASGTDEEGA